MRILSLVGARPQFVKLAPICREFERRRDAGQRDLEHLIVHSGQHYDPSLSEMFFTELALPRPDANLGIGSGPHGQQTGRMMERFEVALTEMAPDAVLVYGDTNTTLAGALVTAKLGIPLVHVEAGLRSFNRAMPEEINRIATDHISDLLLAPTEQAMTLLAGEGLTAKAVRTGDVNYDAVLQHVEIARQRSQVLHSMQLGPRAFVVVTVHRSENAEGGRLQALLQALQEYAATGTTVVFPVHPRTQAAFPEVLDAFRAARGMRLVEPVGYLDMLQLVANARTVLTDSGGLQKEAFFLDTPCITLREETEWIETVGSGANVLTGMDTERIRAAMDMWNARVERDDELSFSKVAGHPFGDGAAAKEPLRRLFHWYKAEITGARS